MQGAIIMRQIIRTTTIASMAAVSLAAALVLSTSPAEALTLTTSSGPLIKTELFRGGTASGTGSWGELAFQFAIPASAIGNGEFHVFAGGDLNNIGLDWIDVTEGAFGDRTLLGTFAFPIGDVHFTACENPPHNNISPCPVPETVPGGMFANPGLAPVGDVQGRRNTTMFDPGIPGLIVPQEMLVADTNLLISLFPRNSIYDLYIDRLELRFPTASPIPEPTSLSLAALGLATLVFLAARRQRG
jgi:PEP-CTERM motif